MISELRKSISSIMYEKVSSPLFGTLIITWLLWNWKIVYLTIFTAESKIEGTKIDYISNNLSDFNVLVTYPVLSTVILLTVVPFISNGAYWLHLMFRKWKMDKKYEVEKKQLLTLEQSIQIREELADKENKFEKLLASRNLEIKQLGLQLESLKQEQIIPEEESIYENKGDDYEIQELAKKILKNENLAKAYEQINYYIQGGYRGILDDDIINSNTLSFFESHDVIRNKGEGFFELTDNGKKINKAISSKKFES